MDWEYPGRRLNRAMAFRLSMLALRTASVNNDWGSEEAVWAVDHLVTEIRSKSPEEPVKEVVEFLQKRKYKRIEFVDSLRELNRLWDEYLAQAKSAGPVPPRHASAWSFRKAFR